MNRTYLPNALHCAVKEVAFEIQKSFSLADRQSHFKTEKSLRIELAECMLGSQVTSSAANLAVARLKRAGLFNDAIWSGKREEFEDEVFCVLCNSERRFDDLGGYRFPRVRANQLARLRLILQNCSILEMVQSQMESLELRAWLVSSLPGIGPKQASMFLRNIGYSFDLAILDSHVVRFLEGVSLLSEKSHLSTLSGYAKTETVMKDYASRIGQPVGLLDWAIWITMKAAKEARA
jgi:N-glycosylase/DNA lyase